MPEINVPVWVKKTLGRINLSDEGQAILFFNLIVKNYKKAISDREKQIDKINSEMEDWLENENEVLKELKEEVVIISQSIDPDKIRKQNDRVQYFEEFDRILSEAIERVAEKESSIEMTKKANQEKIEKIQLEIGIFNLKLSYLEISE